MKNKFKILLAILLGLAVYFPAGVNAQQGGASSISALTPYPNKQPPPISRLTPQELPGYACDPVGFAVDDPVNGNACAPGAASNVDAQVGGGNAARRSSHSALAGNPTSLLGNEVKRQSDLYFNSGNTANNKANKGYGATARFGRFNQGKQNVESYSLPLSYKFDRGNDQIILSLPLAYTRVDNADPSYQIGVGIGYKRQITDNWSLTPAASWATVGTDDLDALGQVVSGSLTSVYSWELGTQHNIKLSLANMVSYYETLADSNARKNAGNFDRSVLTTDLSNWVIKNGIMGSMPTNIKDVNFNLEVYLTDTEFFGDQLFIEQYNEFGASFTVADKDSLFAGFGVNITYLFSLSGDDVEGFTGGIGYEF